MWRKSWCSENIHGQNGNGDCSKRKLGPAERSVWDDYLDMATPPLTPIAGQVCISKDIGYTPEQLSIVLKTPVEVIKSANTAMCKLGMVTIENNGIVIINNWKAYQSEYERQKGYRTGLQGKVTQKGNKVDKDIDIDKKYIRKEYKQFYTSILSHWNSKKIIVHKYLTSYALGKINAKFDHDFTIEDIKKAVDNYHFILKDKAYFWTKEWALGDFLQRGFDKFLDLEGAQRRYADKYREKDMFLKEVEEGKKKMRTL